jgi:mRNA-degrading endonuclease toxin of MazEF toxin-antitoxin module
MPPGQGSIVWVTITDPRGGNPKSRPAVVVTPTAAIEAGCDVQLAAITTLIGQAPFSETVELPHAAGGHPRTMLKKPCEVVCSWVVSAPLADVSDSGGSVPPDVLIEILAKVQRLA